jgi:hypothetical protein
MSLSRTLLAQAQIPTTATTAQSFDDSLGWLHRITDAQLREAYGQLPADRQRLVDAMNSDQRKQYLGGRYAAHHRPIPAADLQFDPELRAIVDERNDELEPRQPVVDRILAYIANNPTTPFAADLYYNVAQLYSGWSKRLLGEEGDHANSLAYFRKAHAIYGDKFCPHNELAWASLANGSGSMTEQLAHYDWLRGLAEHGGPDDVYPTRDFEQTFNGRPAQLTPEEKSRIIDLYRTVYVSVFLSVAERNIMGRAGNDEQQLKKLATAYPDETLGREAASKLAMLAKAK